MNERIDGGRGDISVAVEAVMRICPVRCFGILLFYLFFGSFLVLLLSRMPLSFLIMVVWRIGERKQRDE